MRLNKFIVQVVFVEEDDEGNIIGEQITDPVPIYGFTALSEFANQISEKIVAPTHE